MDREVVAIGTDNDNIGLYVNTYAPFVDGKIVEEGTHDSLLKEDGIYTKMWNDYQKSIKWRVKNA